MRFAVIPRGTIWEIADKTRTIPAPFSKSRLQNTIQLSSAFGARPQRQSGSRQAWSPNPQDHIRGRQRKHDPEGFPLGAQRCRERSRIGLVGQSAGAQFCFLLIALNSRKTPLENHDAGKELGPGPAGILINAVEPIASRPAINVSPSEGKKIQVAIPPIAPRISAYSESDAGAGVKLSSTRRHAIAPMSPIAPIVCMNFSNRRTASIA